ncbi:hypothetical protein DFJ58DRAFT_728407 [Suillus subalutaceus]|uniref:uncharacterized protein n=1 Tax=Suillus subalutaceus TaxID=48586 RepID=UPI001B883A51|nr:uncharacterized protein DFJ58DRAFT_728407 [Suillus subalutaceus]KAG1852756.1 hypothetical protein DFJ58DRAFT_728407 [Suillus subalutaceus]
MGQQKKTTQVVDSGDVEPPHRSGQANTGAGGAISQLRWVGNAIASPVKVLKLNAPNDIIPPDEIENVMAPSNLKNRKRKKGTCPSKPTVALETSDPTAAGPTPVLHVAEHGRFGLQDYPLPSAYVSSKPLQTDQIAQGSCNPPQPDLTSHVQPPTHPVKPSAHPVKPSARPVKLSARPVKLSARPVKPSARPVKPPARPVEPPARPELLTIQQALPGGSASSACKSAFVDRSDDETEQTRTDREMDVKEDFDMEKNRDASFEGDFDVEENWDASFKEDDDEEDANIEEDDIDATIDGEEHKDLDGDLYGTVTAPMDHDPLDHTNRRLGQAGQYPNIDYDLLQCHHSNNHRPRSPPPSYLIGVSGQRSNLHPKSKHPCKNNPSPADDGSDRDDYNVEFECDSGVQSCSTKKNKNAKGTANPTTLGFFPPLWVRLLDFAKANFRQHLANVAPFPQRESAIDDGGVCGKIIAEAIVDWQEQKHQLKKGYYPKFKAEMAIVIQNVLDIYSRHGQANTKQTNITDSEVIYKKIASLFKRVQDDEYHGPKLRKMLQSWVQTGMNKVTASDEDGGGGSEWEVDLD